VIPSGIERAIERGYDSASNYLKDGPSPYNYKHPLFAFWWAAVVLKADCRDYGLCRIKTEVLAKTKWRGRE
jgi:hypothetical protein